MVTAKEAKKILLEQRRRNRERQKEHMKKMREQGYRRIAVLISDVADKALEQAVKDQNRTKSELVTEAIISVFCNSKTKVNSIIKKNKSTNNSDKIRTTKKMAQPTTIESDEIIIKLKADGMSYKTIADKCNADGIPTASGTGQWHKGTVGNVIKRLKKEGRL